MAGTLVFTSPIPIPNLTRARICVIRDDADADTLIITWEVIGIGGAVYGRYYQSIRNGMCDVLGQPGAPTGYNDRFGVLTPVNLATGYADALNAWAGGGTSAAAKRKALEEWCSTNNLLPPGTVS
jgi:hypothetical protein